MMFKKIILVLLVFFLVGCGGVPEKETCEDNFCEVAVGEIFLASSNTGASFGGLVPKTVISNEEVVKIYKIETIQDNFGRRLTKYYLEALSPGNAVFSLFFVTPECLEDETQCNENLRPAREITITVK